MSLLINEFFSEPDDAGSGSQSEPLTRSGIEKMLEDDDEETVDLNEAKKPTKEDSSEEVDDSDSGSDDEETEGNEDEDDPLKELEEDLEEPDDTKLELTTPVKRKDILKEYPDLFKKFPYLEKAYYREQQFTEIFGGIDDAKAAAQDTKILNEFEADLRDGDISKIFHNAHSADKESFHKLVDNILPTLAKVDGDAYHHVIGNVGRQLIYELHQEGQKEGQDHLKQVALLVNQFMFGTSDYQAPGKLSKAPAKNEEAEKLQKERKEFENTRFQSAREELVTRLDNTIRNTIEQNIDSKNSMTPFIKKHAIKDAKEKLDDLIRKDTRFRTILGKYWDRAKASGYSAEAMKEIKSAYITKAKTLLPAVLQSARNEALKGVSRKARENNSEEPSRKGPIPSGKSTTSSNRGNVTPNTKDKGIPPGMSVKQYLMAD